MPEAFNIEMLTYLIAACGLVFSFSHGFNAGYQF